MIKFKEKLRNWAIAHAAGPYSKFWLSLFAFTESFFFPIPPDIILIAILLAKQATRWFFYAMLTTFFSVLGGLFGYLIGFVFFETLGDSIVSLYNLQSQMEVVSQFFAQHGFFAIFLAAFTPIPYKVFTITAGLFSVNIVVFIIASILGRGIRFLVVAYLMKVFGERVASFLYKYFNLVSIIVVAIIALIIYALI